jgi:hypothetical protein
MSLFSRIATAASPAEFAVYGDVCRYLPKGGEPRDQRYVLHDPKIDQPTADGAYFADMELLPGDLPMSPRKRDEVVIGDVAYVVMKVYTPPNANPMVALHRKVVK